MRNLLRFLIFFLASYCTSAKNSENMNKSKDKKKQLSRDNLGNGNGNKNSKNSSNLKLEFSKDQNLEPKSDESDDPVHSLNQNINTKNNMNVNYNEKKFTQNKNSHLQNRDFKYDSKPDGKSHKFNSNVDNNKSLFDTGYQSMFEDDDSFKLFEDSKTSPFAQNLEKLRSEQKKTIEKDTGKKKENDIPVKKNDKKKKFKFNISDDEDSDNANKSKKKKKTKKLSSKLDYSDSDSEDDLDDWAKSTFKSNNIDFDSYYKKFEEDYEKTSNDFEKFQHKRFKKYQKNSKCTEQSDEHEDDNHNLDENKKKEALLNKCFRILEIEENADTETIKKAYKKLALKWHPDRNINNKEEAKRKFIELSAAYENLKSELKFP